MRDYRDAKAMAHTLRAVLATKGLKITISQSLLGRSRTEFSGSRTLSRTRTRSG